MKLEIRSGDKVQVIKGKFSGKEAKVLFIDKKTGRSRLEGLKKIQVKTKKGESKELHGTFHLTSLKLLKQEPPKADNAAKENNPDQKDSATVETKA